MPFDSVVCGVAQPHRPDTNSAARNVYEHICFRFVTFIFFCYLEFNRVGLRDSEFYTLFSLACLYMLGSFPTVVLIGLNQ